MRVVRGSLAAGDYAVTRIFGKTRLLRVTGRSRYVRHLGWHVRVRCIPINATPAVRAMIRRFEDRLAKGGYVFWLTPYYWHKPRVLDWLVGRPRLYGFTSEEEAVQKATSLPDLTFERVLATVLKRLPKRLRPYVFIAALEVADLLQPFRRFPF